MAKLAFFGTPQLAAHILQHLHQFCTSAGHEILFVASQPDKKAGRGQLLSAPPVKTLAEQLDIPVFQPKALRKDTPEGEAFFEYFSKQNLDLAIVVAYGLIVPKRFLQIPKHGFLNIHASLLPRWRGAAPIQRAIMAGDSETGIALMDMTPELDAGDVYVTEKVDITVDDTTPTLSQKLETLAKSMLSKYLPDILEGESSKTPQSLDGLTYASMLKKEDGLLEFNQPTQTIINRHRALIGWPGSYVIYQNKRIALFDITAGPKASDAKPGTVLSISEQLQIATCDGSIFVGELQLEGKRRLPFKSFAQGHPLFFSCGQAIL